MLPSVRSLLIPIASLWLAPSLALAQAAPPPAAPAPQPPAQAQLSTEAAGTPAAVARLTNQITPGQGLTAEDAARRARASSHELRAGRDDVAASQAAIDSARAGYVPRVQGVARYTRLSDIGANSLGSLVATPAGTPAGPIPSGTPLINVPLSFPSLVDNYAFQATLTVPLSDYFLRVPQGIGAAESAADASEASLAATTNNVDLGARTIYYMWVRARLQVGVAEAALETARGHLEDVQKAFNVGSASKADVLRVESLQSQAELNLVRARNAAELTETRLRTVLHDDGQAPLAIGEDVLAELPVADEELAGLIRRALESRPELRVLSSSAAATRGRAKLQRAAHFPRVDLVGNLTDANPNQRVFPQADDFRMTWDVSAQLTWTPTDFFGAKSAVRETEARAAQLESQREAAADGVRIEVVSAWQAVKEARQAIATTTKALGTSEEAYRVRRALFQNGRATNLELTDAELDLTRARLDAVNARIDLRVAKANVAKAVGGQ